MTLTEYKQNVPRCQQAIIRHDEHKMWYAVLADDKAWHDNNGSTIRRQSAAALYTYLQYCGFSPRYEA